MKIGIVGAGTMGRGIAEVCARAGFSVRITDDQEDAYKSVFGILSKKIGNGLVIPTSCLQLFDDVDFVIEAVVEDEDIKRNVFAQLDAICPPHVIFATNTSSIPIRTIASAVSDKRKKNTVGMHFMNPPKHVTLLELIAGVRTSKGTMRTTRALARVLGRNPIIKAPDIPGFLVNRLLMAPINEAAYLIQRGLVSPEDVDASNVLGVGGTSGMPILKLVDLIGVDVCLAILLQIETEDRFFTPMHIFKQMVGEGRLGRKTGRGFFDYPPKGDK